MLKKRNFLHHDSRWVDRLAEIIQVGKMSGSGRRRRAAAMVKEERSKRRRRAGRKCILYDRVHPTCPSMNSPANEDEFATDRES